MRNVRSLLEFLVNWANTHPALAIEEESPVQEVKVEDRPTNAAISKTLGGRTIQKRGKTRRGRQAFRPQKSGLSNVVEQNELNEAFEGLSTEANGMDVASRPGSLEQQDEQLMTMDS